MFCARCGATVNQGPAFCADCGAPTAIASPSGAEGAQPQERYYDTPQTKTFEVAGFGQRLGAWLLDLVFSSIIGAIVGVAGSVVIAALVAATQGDTTFLNEGQQEQDVENAFIGGLYLGWFAGSFGYQWISGALGGGWGKRIVGLRIVNSMTGESPGLGGGFVRALVSILSRVFYLGYLWALWDPEKQTWHDKAADTIVIHAR